jgi:hypothetical protein
MFLNKWLSHNTDRFNKPVYIHVIIYVYFQSSEVEVLTQIRAIFLYIGPLRPTRLRWISEIRIGM